MQTATHVVLNTEQQRHLCTIFECNICCDFLQQDLLETKCCNTLYCTQCLTSWQRANKICPNCRKGLLDFEEDCKQNIPVVTFIKNMNVSCPNKIYGCLETRKNKDMDEHLLHCNYSSEKLQQEQKMSLNSIRKEVSKTLSMESMLWKKKDEADSTLIQDFTNSAINYNKENVNSTISSNIQNKFIRTHILTASNDNEIMNCNSIAIKLCLLASKLVKIRKFALAIKLINKALNIYTIIKGNLHVKVVYCYDLLASIYVTISEFELAISYYTKIINLVEQATNVNNKNNAINDSSNTQKNGSGSSINLVFGYVISSQKQLGLLYTKRSNFFEAKQQLTTALALSKRHLGDNAIETGLIYNALGDMYIKTGQLNEAIQALLDAMAILGSFIIDTNKNKDSNKNNSDFISSIFSNLSASSSASSSNLSSSTKQYNFNIIAAKLLKNLGDIYYKQGKYNLSRENYINGLSSVERQYGCNHILASEIYNSFGLLAKKEGNYNEAILCYNTAIKICKLLSSKQSPLLGTCLQNLGDVYRKLGQFNKAEVIYFKARQIFEESFGYNSEQVAETFNSTGLIMKKRTQYQSAENYYNKAIVIIKSCFNDTHYKIGIYTNNLADVYRKRKQYNEALIKYKEALDIIKSSLGPFHIEAAEIQHNMAIVYKDIKKYEKSYTLFKRAISIIKIELGTDHYKFGLFLNNFGLLNNDTSNFAIAYAQLQSALSVLLKALGNNHIEVADCYVNIGDVCINLHKEQYLHQNNTTKLHEAILNYTKAKDIYSKSFCATHPKLKELNQKLISSKLDTAKLSVATISTNGL